MATPFKYKFMVASSFMKNITFSKCMDKSVLLNWCCIVTLCFNLTIQLVTISGLLFNQ